MVLLDHIWMKKVLQFLKVSIISANVFIKLDDNDVQSRIFWKKYVLNMFRIENVQFNANNNGKMLYNIFFRVKSSLIN